MTIMDLEKEQVVRILGLTISYLVKVRDELKGERKEQVAAEAPAANGLKDEMKALAETAKEQVLSHQGPPIHHNKPMVWVEGKNGPFWSCHTKNPDGTWCNYRPPQAA
jgi:hypothetical protein